MHKEIEFFNSFAATWDSIRETNPRVLQQLMQLASLHNGAAVLDVGSGTGVLLPYLHTAVGETGTITAVDFSEKMLAKAQEKFAHLGNINFVVGDILELQLPAASYDAITCLNFYPHLHTRKQEFITKMHAALRDDGSLIIMHDISREKVNNIHHESEPVKEHRLPEAVLVGAQLQTAGYHDIHAYEDDSLYFVKGSKQRELNYLR